MRRRVVPERPVELDPDRVAILEVLELVPVADDDAGVSHGPAPGSSR